MFLANTDAATDVTPDEAIVRVVQLGMDLNLPCTSSGDEGIRFNLGQPFFMIYTIIQNKKSSTFSRGVITECYYLIATQDFSSRGSSFKATTLYSKKTLISH